MPAFLRFLRCEQCLQIHALPERPERCPRCGEGTLSRLADTDEGAIAYFASTMR